MRSPGAKSSHRDTYRSDGEPLDKNSGRVNELLLPPAKMEEAAEAEASCVDAAANQGRPDPESGRSSRMRSSLKGVK
jgi:hypothetical protein